MDGCDVAGAKAWKLCSRAGAMHCNLQWGIGWWLLLAVPQARETEERRFVLALWQVILTSFFEMK